jgi:hypothetical protein
MRAFDNAAQQRWLKGEQTKTAAPSSLLARMQLKTILRAAASAFGLWPCCFAGLAASII